MTQRIVLIGVLTACSISLILLAAAFAKPEEDELHAVLARIARTCNVEENLGLVDCEGSEQRKLAGEFRSHRRSRPKAVGSVARALVDKSPGVAAAAVNLLSQAFSAGWGPEAKQRSVSASDADQLLAAVVALPPTLAEQALPGAVHAAVLADRARHLFEVLDSLQDGALRVVGIRAVMIHGRLNAFSKIRGLAEEEPRFARAALEGVRSMPDWAEEERNEICPWARRMLERRSFTETVATLLDVCANELADALLVVREANLREGHVTMSELVGFYELCGERRRGEPLPPSLAQCQRVRDFLSGAIESSVLDGAVRGAALNALAYQFPDEATLKLAERCRAAAHGTLLETAVRVVQRLTESTSSE